MKHLIKLKPDGSSQKEVIPGSASQQNIGLIIINRVSQKFKVPMNTLVVNDVKQPLHKHNATVAFICQGTGYILTPTGRHELTKGDMVFIPENLPHISVAKTGTSLIELVVTLPTGVSAI